MGKTLPRMVSLLALFFAFQVGVAVPAHNLHGATKAESPADADDTGGSAAADGHCSFFLAFCSLDSGSVAEPPAFRLEEAREQLLPRAADAFSSGPSFAYQARGPPVVPARS